MSSTPNFGFPLLAPSQAQPEVTVNASLLAIDSIIASNNASVLAAAIAAAQAAAAAAVSASDTYTYTQSIPAAVWVITHNLVRFPAVVVVDSSGGEVEGDVEYTDANHLTLTFSAPFSGVAYLT